MIIRKAVEFITSMAFLMLVAGNFYQKKITQKKQCRSTAFLL